MYRKLWGNVEERVKSLEKLKRNRDSGGKNHHLIFKPEHPTEKETGSVHRFFVHCCLKEIKVIHSGNKWDVL